MVQFVKNRVRFVAECRHVHIPELAQLRRCQSANPWRIFKSSHDSVLFPVLRPHNSSLAASNAPHSRIGSSDGFYGGHRPHVPGGRASSAVPARCVWDTVSIHEQGESSAPTRLMVSDPPARLACWCRTRPAGTVPTLWSPHPRLRLRHGQTLAGGPKRFTARSLAYIIT